MIIIINYLQPTPKEKQQRDLEERLKELELENIDLKAEKHELKNRIANKNSIIRQKEKDIDALKSGGKVFEFTKFYQMFYQIKNFCLSKNNLKD